MKVYLSGEPNRALLLRASPAADAQVVTALLDAVVALLAGKGRRQKRDQTGTSSPAGVNAMVGGTVG